MSVTVSRRRATLLTAAVGALASLTLTACGASGADVGRAIGGEPSPAGASAGASASASGQGASDGTSGDAKTPVSDKGSSSGTSGGSGTSGSGKESSSGKDSSSGNDSSGSSAGSMCTDTEVTAQAVSRPINHLLLTVTNTGSRTCSVYGYPALRFTGAQSVPPVIEDSQPQAVLTLAPGEKGYAGVGLSAADGSGTGGYRAKTLSLSYQDRNLEFTDEGAEVPLPAKGVYVDSSLSVTYWQYDAQTALTW
ncbi:DUF4232 domain-containing protein [Streptomyces sp. NPDC090106]|uniref:DUF4232 domain-containing protein n=1 Tax=Streptomyces sp. NPDC090106 TaxID=3365946 RepID=UPI003821A669